MNPIVRGWTDDQEKKDYGDDGEEFVVSLADAHFHDDHGHAVPATREQLIALRDQINAVIA